MFYVEQDQNYRVLEDGSRLQRTDPYGFWIILDKKGRKILDEAFTSTRDALNALENRKKT